jgi:hypothetical protein
MFEDEIICLGAGIISSTTNTVNTTVENRRLGSDRSNTLWIDAVPYSPDNDWSTTITTNNTPVWCALENVAGYYFPASNGDLKAAFIERSGSWTDIRPTDSDETLYTDNYLQLWFDHGASPSNASYAYVLLPNATPMQTRDYAANPASSILVNNANIQAVKNIQLGLTAANFWALGGGTTEWITVNRKASFIAEENTDSISVGIADPTHATSGPLMTVTLDRPATSVLEADSGVTVTQLTPTIIFTVATNNSKGKTFEVTFAQAAQAPTITSSQSVSGNQGQPFSYMIQASNSPTSYAASGLPSGLAIDTVTGLISGIPQNTGTSTATITASNVGGSGALHLSLIIGEPLPVINSSHTLAGIIGIPFSYTISATNSPNAFYASGLPSTLSLDQISGRITGKPNETGTFPLLISAINSGGTNVAKVNDTRVNGGDTWFNKENTPSDQILAKGGQGGESAVGNSSTTRYGSGGIGTTSGSLGDSVLPGGSGATAESSMSGGGGSSPSSSGVGISTTTNIGATAPDDGGDGGTGPTTSSGPGQDGKSPGGGGSGARAVGPVRAGGSGGDGQIIITAHFEPISLWREHYFNTTENSRNSADTHDADGDGLSNAEEYAFGTNPVLPEAEPLLRIVNINNQMGLHFTALATSGLGYESLNRHYTLEVNNDLSLTNNCISVSGMEDIVGSNQNIQSPLNLEATSEFYRLKTWLE